MRRYRIMTIACCLSFHLSSGQIADDKCKFLGNIIGSSTPADFLTNWNQVTPENAGKWGSVEGTRDVMNWAALENAYNTAKNNDIPFRQHTLVWGQQQPTWLSSLTPDEQKQEVEEWIKGFCERYPQTDFIDVVNEPLHAVPAYSVAIGGNGATGWDWVVWTFEKARQYCPNAKLFLNDYNIVNNNSATTTFLQIINLLKSKNLIDGIGEQGHFMESTPVATIKSNLDKLAATGLPIHISEFDINVSDDTQQKNKYEELFPVLWTHVGVHGITLWGYKEGQVWRENAYLTRLNGTDRPAFTWLKNFVSASDGGALCSPVGVEPKEPRGYNAYPNPSPGRISISVPQGTVELIVLDLHGKIVQHVSVADSGMHQFDFQGAVGPFMLKLVGSHGTFYKRIIVN